MAIWGLVGTLVLGVGILGLVCNLGFRAVIWGLVGTVVFGAGIRGLVTNSGLGGNNLGFGWYFGVRGGKLGFGRQFWVGVIIWGSVGTLELGQ